MPKRALTPPGFFAQLYILVYHLLLIKRHKYSILFAEIVLPCLVIFTVIVFANVRATGEKNEGEIMDKSEITFPTHSWNSPPWIVPYYAKQRIRRMFFVPDTSSAVEIGNSISACLDNYWSNATQHHPDFWFRPSQKYRTHFLPTRSALEKEVYNSNTSYFLAVEILDEETGEYEIRDAGRFIPSGDEVYSGICDFRSRINGSEGDNLEEDMALWEQELECASTAYFLNSFVLLQSCAEHVLSQRMVGSGFLELFALISPLQLPTSNLQLPLTSSRPLPLRPRPPHPSRNHSSATPLLFGLAWSIICVFMVLNLVGEKSSRLKQQLKLAGMRVSAYWVAFLIVYFFLYAIVTAIIVISVKSFGENTTIANTHWSLLTVFLLISALFFISYAFMAAPFFTNPMTGFTMAFCANFLTIAAHWAMTKQHVENFIFYVLVSMFGNFGFVVGIDRLELIQRVKGKVEWGDVFLKPDGLMSLGQVIGFIVLNTVIYSVLGFVADYLLSGNSEVRRKVEAVVKRLMGNVRKREGESEGEESALRPSPQLFFQRGVSEFAYRKSSIFECIAFLLTLFLQLGVREKGICSSVLWFYGSLYGLCFDPPWPDFLLTVWHISDFGEFGKVLLGGSSCRIATRCMNFFS